MGRWNAPKACHIVLIDLGRTIGQFTDGDAVTLGAVHDLVFDVRDVAHIGHVLFAIDIAQNPEQQIKSHSRAAIADMGKVIDRRSAGIEAHIGRINRLKHPLRACGRVVEAEGHIT